ncbi:transcription elongation factor A N-terminal and central domain-containing protein [Tachysurus fulvidraco]|uniref:transcription elongation factor A N-terminal and central domain-containing protein n=1 Tax=Tachysurus fulvidraco TaxID=1234273 RepID=UPI001FEE1E5B|nr:transcription elongation factor A N-terminal and central domain-containing protein [Tachysurus fulvidraco]
MRHLAVTVGFFFFAENQNKHGGLDFILIDVKMEIKEITRMAIQIEKFHKDGNYEDILCLLTDIYSTHVTLEQLQTTDICKSIYQLIKPCPVASVRKRGKGVLSKWKRLYGSPHEHKHIKDTSNTKECEATEQDKAGASKRDLDQKVNDQESCESSSMGDASLNDTTVHPPEDDVRTPLTVPSPNTGSTKSSVLRNKCVELLIQALNPDQAYPELTSQLAHTIETHIDTVHGHNLPKYKSCIRSKVANLKNPKNPHLRQGLLSGTLAPEVFAKMSAQEMAGEELRQLRQGYTAAGISERQLPQGLEGTATSKVRCQHCDGMDCRVTQISRGTLFLPSWVKRGSDDEQAMTFMTCANCGAQWYHNRWVCF